jgi:hypothetical protein
VWDHVHTALSPQGDELSPRGSWGICVPVLPEGLTVIVLQKRLKTFGYYPEIHTPGLWLRNTKPTAFSLVVDDFAAKYVTTADAHHLRNALLRHYEITTDWDGTVYSGITLDWDYNKRTCDISMPG